MPTLAYLDGQLVILQDRATSTVTWVYADGQLGGLPVGQATSAGTFKAAWARGSNTIIQTIGG